MSDAVRRTDGARVAYEHADAGLTLIFESLPWGKTRLAFEAEGRAVKGLLACARERYGEDDGYTRSLAEAEANGTPATEFVPQGFEGEEFAEDLEGLRFTEAAHLVRAWAVKPEYDRLIRESERYREAAEALLA